MNKYCVSKKVLLPSIFVLVLVVYALFSSTVTRNKMILQNKAAPSKLIGGIEVVKGEYPAVTLLSNECTGTLIAPQWVLTAAHCVEPGLSVAVGIVNRSDFESNKVDVIDTIEAPPNPNLGLDLAEGDYDDIALLLLEKEISGITIPSLPQLPRDNYMYDAGPLVRLVGWGCDAILPTPGTTIAPVRDGNYLISMPDKLQKLLLPIFSSQIASNHPNRFLLGYNDERSLTQTACWGDSGGPTFYIKDEKLFLIGIHVRGGSGIINQYVQETKVINFTNWIQSTISKYVIPTPTPLAPDGEWMRCDNNSTSCDAFCKSKGGKCWGAQEVEVGVPLTSGTCSQTRAIANELVPFWNFCNLAFNTSCFCSPKLTPTPLPTLVPTMTLTPTPKLFDCFEPGIDLETCNKNHCIWFNCSTTEQGRCGYDGMPDNIVCPESSH